VSLLSGFSIMNEGINMHRATHTLTILLGSMLALFLIVASAQAQTRTWVSGVGDDVNPCSRTAPCKTFAGAISKTAVNGEINCLDPGGFGAVTITKSITIDCHEVFASILNSGTSGIIVNFGAFAVGDVRKTVRLRNLNINGADTGLIGIRIIGATSSGSEVFIEDTLIDGMFGGTARGISDERSGGGELYVTNTTVRNTGATGIVVLPATGATRIDAMLENVRVENCNFGAALNNGARVMINRSVFSGNTQAGVHAEGPLGGVEVNVNDSVMTGNAIGVQNLSGTVTIRLSNNDIAFNTTAVNGATQSFGNNRISGTVGTVPTFIGADAPAKGQR
jgi:hypothetical protein